jgi:signal transduction histidine kinase
LLSKAHQDIEKMERFLRYIFHEVRGPTGVIRQLAELLYSTAVEHSDRFRSGFDPNSLEGREFLQNIKSSLESFESDAQTIIYHVDIVSHIFNNILCIEQMKSGKFQIHRHPVDVSKLLTNLRQHFSIMAEHKQISIETDIQEGLPLFMIDLVHLRGVLINFITNAIKYSPANTTITLRVHDEADRILSGEPVPILVGSSSIPKPSPGETKLIFEVNITHPDLFFLFNSIKPVQFDSALSLKCANVYWYPMKVVVLLGVKSKN